MLNMYNNMYNAYYLIYVFIRICLLIKNQDDFTAPVLRKGKSQLF